MSKKSIIAACCMAGMICILFAACAVAGNEAMGSELQAAYNSTKNPDLKESAAPPEMQTALVLTADRERYQEHIDLLDAALADNQARQEDCSLYRENISSIYTFSDYMSGWLLAAHDGQGILLVDWLMDVGVGEEGSRQRYRLFLLDDGSWYFTYQTDGLPIEEDVPDYLVNEDALRYYRIDYVYDDGSNLEEKRRGKEAAWQSAFDRTISGETQEYWYMDGTLYAVDRQEKTLADVSGTAPACISAFLQLQPGRIAAQLNLDEERAAQAESLIPKDYCLLYDWDDMAAYDLNKDGIMDYVMVLYPKDYPNETRYEGFSPYERSSQYYAAEFWLFLSDPEEGYLPTQLTDNIEYPWDSSLVLTDISFVGNGLLQLEYFIGRAPWCTAMVLFEPRIDQDNRNFFMHSSYFRDSFTDGIQIGDRENYGEESIREYFSGHSHYRDDIQVRESETSLGGSNVLGHYSNTQYRCDDRWNEQMLNSRIWQRENDILEAVQKEFVSEDFTIDTDAIFWNRRIVSQSTELEVWRGTRLGNEKGEEPDLWRTTIPNMFDRNTGEAIHVTDFITKEDFLELFQRYARREKWNRNVPLTDEEMAQCLAILEEGWEEADSLESLTAFDWKEISLQITQQGVTVGLRTDGTYGLSRYLIDKEHFMGTGLWYYLSPEWMQ